MERYENVGRIGLLADTHDEKVDWDTLHPAVAAALGDVDLVLLCGDLQTMHVLDRLAELAPVIAVRGELDPPPSPPVLLDGPRMLDLAGTTVAVIRRQPEGGGWPDQIAGAGVVVFGGTHVPTVDTVDGVLYINPGSPSLAQALTVGVLELGAGGPTARIVPFERPQ